MVIWLLFIYFFGSHHYVKDFTAESTKRNQVDCRGKGRSRGTSFHEFNLGDPGKVVTPLALYGIIGAGDSSSCPKSNRNHQNRGPEIRKACSSWQQVPAWSRSRRRSWRYVHTREVRREHFWASQCEWQNSLHVQVLIRAKDGEVSPELVTRMTQLKLTLAS